MIVLRPAGRTDSFFPALLLLVLLLAAFLFYRYSVEQTPESVRESTNTISRVNAIRFIMKSGLLSQKGLATYLRAVEKGDQGLLDDAVDYFDASEGFLQANLIGSSYLLDHVAPRIETVVSLVRRYGLQPPSDEIDRIRGLVNEIWRLTEREEKRLWQDVQRNYIEFRVQEHKVYKLYQAALIGGALVLLFILWMYLRQRRLNRIILEHEAELRELAYGDTLTRIPNRKYLEILLKQQIRSAERHGHGLYVALIDLDDFKKINDALGHSAGDQALRACAERLGDVVRSEDHIGRLGGDEFLVIFDHHVTRDELMHILRRIVDTFKQPLTIGNTGFYLSISMGIAHFPSDTDDWRELIKFADIAMYKAKGNGKDQYQFYDTTLGDLIRREYELDMEISRALKQGEFELFYQPQVDTASDRVVGAEALVRWHHPERGLLPPGEFIDVIEKGYHTKEFGEWVIAEAGRQQRAWREQGLDIRVSINLSVRHILSPDFHDRVRALVEESGADLERLVFEITEYEMMEYRSQPMIELERLSEAGFHFHLDDFGTGYSSISYLSQLPVAGIKIDKSFVDRIQPDNDERLLVDAIIHIAHALNMVIIAEGVENLYQYDYLKAHGCTTIQGYFFSPPLPLGKFEEYLAQHRRRIDAAHPNHPA